MKRERVKSNLDAFIRSLDEAQDQLSPQDEIRNRRLRTERIRCERDRLARLTEHKKSLRLGDGELDQVASRSFESVSQPQQPRSFDLRKKKIRRLRAEFRLIGSVPNPYSFGCYHCIVEALALLGVNEYHPFGALRSQVEELMGSTRWRVFAHRESLRHRPRIVEDVERDANARLQYNCRVLQRTKSYGLKLLQVGQIIMGTKGCVIDIAHRAGQTMYRLNADAAEPRYEPAKGRRKRRLVAHASRSGTCLRK